MPATALKGYTIMTTGSESGTWGDELNDSMISFLDENMAGTLALSLASSNVVLTATQARKSMIRCTGVLLANVTISPDVGVLWNGFYFIDNATTGNFTVTLSNSAGSVAIPQSRRAIVFIDSTNGPRLFCVPTGTNGSEFATGTVVPFYQAAAPTGWTIVALNDYALRINSTGGGAVTAGTAFSTVMSATRAVTGTSGSTVLTIAQIPAHTHTYDKVAFGSGGSSGFTVARSVSSAATGSEGGGLGHDHGAGTYVVNLGVQYATMILATKT